MTYIVSSGTLNPTIPNLVFLLILVFDSEVLIVVPVLDEWSLAASLLCIIFILLHFQEI